MQVIPELVETAAERRKNRPPAAQAIMDDATDALAASGIAGQAIQAGDRAPAFVLPNALGESVALADALSQGPVVLSFYRGAWCPYCNLELRILQDHLDAIAAAGASLIAVSPMTPDHSLSVAEKHDLGFQVLSDAGNGVARAYGLVFRVDDALNELYLKMGIDLEASNGEESHELPIPATYVIGPDGIVLLGYADPDYTRRLAIDEILAALAAIEEA
jgi:peroxiredoxin